MVHFHGGIQLHVNMCNFKVVTFGLLRLKGKATISYFECEHIMKLEISNDDDQGVLTNIQCEQLKGRP